VAVLPDAKFLKGTDCTVYFCSDARLYAIATSNLPPVASAGPEQWVIYGEKVTLDGSHSLDPDGNIVSYEWNLGDGESASGPRV
ncbi:MAG TPA: PKD domain-containing protein, partial [Candidatus Tripitaka californicus]|uniref:PKD domain-containing protein n=1 Tax=Candidatus Tripitaka californicus TaxID=3367616 RepID=UPI0040251BF6